MGGLTPWPNRLISSNRPSTRSPTQDSATTAPAEDPLLRSVSGSAGIRPDGQYLAGHTCHLARVSVKPFTPPKRDRPPGKPWGGPRLSKQEIAEFKRIWNMPYSRLKYEKAPTVVGQGDEIQSLF